MGYGLFSRKGLWFLLIIGIANRIAAYNNDDATSLHTRLFKNYTESVLPSYPVDVRVEFNLMTVNSLEMTSQTLSTSGWFTVIWTDSRLDWNPTSYGDTDHIFVKQSTIWHPLLMIANSENGEWDLVSTYHQMGQIIEGNLTYSKLQFWMKLHRYPGHYIMSVIFPVILISVLSGITFILPVESGAMIGYILTVVLALAVLLTLFSDHMPTTSKHTPVLVVYLTVTLGLATLVIIIIVLITYLYYRDDDFKVPGWMYRFVHKCKQIKCGQQTRMTGSVSPGETNNDDQINRKELYALYSNKDIAHFWGNFFFLVFFFLYTTVSLVFTITLGVAT